MHYVYRPILFYKNIYVIWICRRSDFMYRNRLLSLTFFIYKQILFSLILSYCSPSWNSYETDISNKNRMVPVCARPLLLPKSQVSPYAWYRSCQTCNRCSFTTEVKHNVADEMIEQGYLKYVQNGGKNISEALINRGEKLGLFAE